jgi:TrmH family RNA methyltransferase
MMELITSRKNPTIVHLKRLGADAAYRRERGLYLCQGGKLYEEALGAGAEIREVLYCGTAPELPGGAAAYRTREELLEHVSPMPSAPELVFSCALPKNNKMPDGGRIIILEDMQDPGNVGAIMRTAAAFGFGGLILAGGCADPYGPKAVRASMGAVFKTGIYQCGADELRGLKVPIFAAALSGDAADLRDRRPFPRASPLPSATRAAG